MAGPRCRDDARNTEAEHHQPGRGVLGEEPGGAEPQLDAYRLLNDLVAHPADFGLTNVTTACVTPYVLPFTCDSPDEYLFWDGIHPTKAVHAIIAAEAGSVLGQ